MTAPPAFLSDRKPRVVALDTKGFDAPRLHLGRGNPALEVLVVGAPATRSPVQVRALWKERHGGRAAPLLVVVVHDTEHVSLCGPVGLKDDPPVYAKIDRGQAERMCAEALSAPNKEAALRFVRDALPAIQSDIPGVRNEGFFATHELKVGAPKLPGWADLTACGRGALGKGDDDLLAALGFSLEPLGTNALSTLLRESGDGSRVGVAVVLQPGEVPDLEAERFNHVSPVDYAMVVAEREALRYVFVCQGAKVRLYPAGLRVGVGGRGRNETFVELHTGLIPDANAGYIWALLSHAALKPGGTLDHLLEESRRFAGDLATRLRERIYELVIPALARGLVDAQKLKKPTAADLTETYRMAMTVLFRLLFIAYAEDMKLLPYDLKGLYQSRSLKKKAMDLKKMHDEKTPFDASDSWWVEVDQVFRAIADGNSDWSVPAYGGDLFARVAGESAESKCGAKLANLKLPNTLFGPVLSDLLLIDSPEGLGPVDFRSLSVREFGTVYEGLLESELAVAETDLTTDAEGNYRPRKGKEDVVVAAGDVYLHNRSGQRKATGTYFTKEFAVDHLLDEALEPALVDHLARVRAVADPTAAAEAFFDFRIADIAMGSAHFLVAAVDRIERAFTAFLAEHNLPGVRAELGTLRAAALKALGPTADVVDDERLGDAALLRRQIARRCVYGVDMNPIAVSLARLSIWIHTFVPGLPLSLLDHNLVCGNSLVGIGRKEELEDALHDAGVVQKGRNAGKQGLLFVGFDVDDLLTKALEPLTRAAKIADATINDVNRVKAALAEAKRATAGAEALCDIVTACRIGQKPIPFSQQEWDALQGNLIGQHYHAEAREALAHMPPFHFPVAFPEVFLRPRAGFDVLLGNPPWEEATLEEHAFWARHQPGIRSMKPKQFNPIREQLRKNRKDLVKLFEEELAEADTMRKALVNGGYPGMGTGDPDLYKAFCWRFWNLIAPDGGRCGMVLPRGALAAKGSAEFRKDVFAGAKDVSITILVNLSCWAFDGMDNRKTFGLVVLTSGAPVGETIGLRGPFVSRERFDNGHCVPLTRFSAANVASWTDTASLPLLPSDESPSVFAQLRKAPRLDLNDGKTWRARPYAELHATNDAELMDLESETCPKGYWPVYKGESFDIWQPDTGGYYGYAEPKAVLAHLHDKRQRAGRNSKSPFSEFPDKWLKDAKAEPCLAPRIAFRDITNRANQRTVIPALLPPKVFLTNKAPYLLFSRGDATDVAYLLGVLSSVPLDWYARRFVEGGMNFYIFNPFPIPRPPAESELRKRVVALAGRLAAVDERFAGWAQSVGVACGPLADNTKQDHIHELDAVVAHLYGLSEPQLVHVFETFHEGWDFGPRLAATREHYKAWAGRG